MPSILLVSNSIDERYVYTRAMRSSGYRVVLAETTFSAYQIAITRPTDIVVTDVRCAGSMTGLELTHRLRTHTRTRTVPIIVITTETRRQDAELALKAGADMFLERPVSGDVLRERVIRLLGVRGRQLRPSSTFLRSVVDNDRARNERTCPHCGGRMEYRHKSPVLSLEPNSRAERLRYVSGWFCSDSACDYRQLAQFRG